MNDEFNTPLSALLGWVGTRASTETTVAFETIVVLLRVAGEFTCRPFPFQPVFLLLQHSSKAFGLLPHPYML